MKKTVKRVEKMQYTVLLLSFVFSQNAFSQVRPMEMAILENPLRDFTLPVYRGGNFTLSSETGKNILLIFPRGYYDKDVWCDICPYQYFDMVDMYEKNDLKHKYNLEIVFILPYNQDVIRKWLLDMPDVNASLVNDRKRDSTSASDKERRWVAYLNKFYYKDFPYKRGEVPEPFKILVDEKHQLSKRLGIFRTEWWGTEVDQNIPTVILLDKNRNVVFKYVGQYTLDRPNAEYLLKVFKTFLKSDQ